MNFKSLYGKLPNWLKFISVETITILVLILAVTIELRHIADSNWLKVFLYNGDSLTLPVIRQALGSRAPFQWIGSSQLSLFPEGLFYAISSIFSDSIRSSLVFNAILNVIVLYCLIRWITSVFKAIPDTYKRLFSLGCCLLLLVYMVLEREPNINYSSLATLFLFSTYYYGIVLATLAVLGITLRQLKSSLTTKTNIILVVVGFLLSALTVFSDPLFIVAYLLPLTITLAFLFILTKIRLKQIIWIVAPQILGGLVGYEARKPFSEYFGQSLSSHISTYNIPATLSVFHTTISTYLHSRSGIIEFLLILGAIIFSLVYVLIWIYRKTHHKNMRLDEGLLLLCLFSFAEAVTLIFFSIATGVMVTRYLLPIVIIPMLGLLPIMYAKFIRNHKKYIVFAAIFVLLATSVVGIISIKNASKLLSTSTYLGNVCLANVLSHKTAYGVGQYWTVRALDVYGQQNEQALQVNPNLTIYPWQANLGSYGNKHFSFIIVNKQPAPDAIIPGDPALPSNPSRISDCNNFYVYQYAPGSKGYTELNKIVNQSYELAESMRASGNIAAYVSGT